MAKIIAICGKICCGKTYYANQIKEKEKAIILSCDELTKDLFDNDLGNKHDEMTLRIWSYFKKKSVELVKVGCTVILDWGFWSVENRRSLTEFCRSHNVPCEWHYIDIDEKEYAAICDFSPDEFIPIASYWDVNRRFTHCKV